MNAHMVRVPLMWCWRFCIGGIGYKCKISHSQWLEMDSLLLRADKCIWLLLFGGVENNTLNIDFGTARLIQCPCRPSQSSSLSQPFSNVNIFFSQLCLPRHGPIFNFNAFCSSNFFFPFSSASYFVSSLVVHVVRSHGRCAWTAIKVLCHSSLNRFSFSLSLSLSLFLRFFIEIHGHYSERESVLTMKRTKSNVCLIVITSFITINKNNRNNRTLKTWLLVCNDTMYDNRIFVATFTGLRICRGRRRCHLRAMSNEIRKTSHKNKREIKREKINRNSVGSFVRP